MTNISSKLEVYLSINGFMMLTIGSMVGALFALLVFMITLFLRADVGGVGSGFCHLDDRLFSGGSKQFL